MASSAQQTPPSPLRQLGDLLREARERAGLKLKEVAERSGTSVTTLSLLERGQREVSPELLERIVAFTGADGSAAFRLAGVASPQALSELLGPDLARALDRGGLSADSRRALRRVHLAALAGSVSPRTDFPPVSAERLLDEEFGIEIRFTKETDVVRFGTPELVELPGELGADEQRRYRNFLLGHMAGHALISRDTDRRPTCNFRAGGGGEGEASWLAGLLLMPRKMLETEAQVFTGPYKLGDPDGLKNFISEVAAAFAVPAWLAARHLGDAGHLAWGAGLEEI